MEPNLKDLMKQAQKLQSSMQKAQQELANTTVIGEAGGGMVKIKMTGQHDARKVRIDPSVAKGMSEEDRKLLEDLFAAAINDAVRKVEKASKAKITDLASGLGGLPQDFNLPADEDDDKV